MSVPLDTVVTHHLNPARSGASRFNQMLAERLQIPCIGILDPRLQSSACPLLSFKVRELGQEERAIVTDLVSSDRRFRAFLHDFADTELERRLVGRADFVYCGNAEVRAAVEGLTSNLSTMWAPGLILDTRRYEPAEITVFSFGMAHKIQVHWFRRLRELLEGTGKTFAVYISNANHETATLEDADVVYDELHRVFPSGLYVAGNLSDVAIYNSLLDCTFYAAFFPDGARANNTSIASAMEQGAVVVTNLDQYSPPSLRHLETVIDIRQCDELPLDAPVLDRLREGAKTAAQQRSWDALAEAIRSS